MMEPRNPFFLIGMIEEAARQIGAGWDHRPLAKQIIERCEELSQSLVTRRVSVVDTDRDETSSRG